MALCPTKFVFKVWEKFHARNTGHLWNSSRCPVFRASTVSVESKNVNLTIVNNWMKELPLIIKYYNVADVYNADETDLFFKASSNKSLVARGDDALGTKISKDGVAILLICSWADEKMKPEFIWKAKIHGAQRSKYRRTFLSGDHISGELL